MTRNTKPPRGQRRGFVGGKDGKFVNCLLKACKDHVPAATSGQRTAYHVLSAQPNFPESLRAGNE